MDESSGITIRQLRGDGDCSRPDLPGARHVRHHFV